jgi:hypothetical protein
MINRRSFWLMVLLVGLILLGIRTQAASALDREQKPIDRHKLSDQLAAQTPAYSISPVSPVTETPETRVLPPVGGNAGLVLGASVLVLIIIGGVMLFSRRRPKH